MLRRLCLKVMSEANFLGFNGTVIVGGEIYVAVYQGTF